MEQTLALIKPDAVERNLIGKILAMIEYDNFRIKHMKLTKMAEPLAETFYSIHKGKSFFDKFGILYIRIISFIQLIKLYI